MRRRRGVGIEPVLRVQRATQFGERRVRRGYESFGRREKEGFLGRDDSSLRTIITRRAVAVLLVDQAIERGCGLGTIRMDGRLYLMQPGLALRAWQRRCLGAEAQQEKQRKEEAFHRCTHRRLDKL